VIQYELAVKIPMKIPVRSIYVYTYFIYRKNRNFEKIESRPSGPELRASRRRRGVGRGQACFIS
jgi:hypothetical protein